MVNSNHVLVVRVASLGNVDYTAIRDDILESVRLGVLILGMDDTLEVMELPPLGGVAVAPAEQTLPISSSDPPVAEPEAEAVRQRDLTKRQREAEEKRAIVQRLKDYRASHGRGCLDAVSEKTARRRDARLSADTLRDICTDGAPKMALSEWRKIDRALTELEKAEEAHG